MVDISQAEKMFLDNCSLSIEDIHVICEEYDIGKLKSVIKHFKRTANTNLLIESHEGRFVVKFFKVIPERYKSIIDFIKITQEHNVPTLLPIQNRNGEYLINIKGYDVQLTPYISASPFCFTPTQMESSGETLKKIHTTFNNDFYIPDPPASIYPAKSVFSEGLVRLENLRESISDEKITLIKNLHERVMNKWDSRSTGLPTAIIHGDWKVDNQLFTRKGDVCCVLDYDFIQRRERLFDIAYALWTFLMNPKYGPITAAFLQGYGPLTEQEINILRIAVARVSLFFLCTASFSKNAVDRVEKQLKVQVPFIEYVLSKDGKKRIAELCSVQ